MTLFPIKKVNIKKNEMNLTLLLLVSDKCYSAGADIFTSHAECILCRANKVKAADLHSGSLPLQTIKVCKGTFHTLCGLSSIKLEVGGNKKDPAFHCYPVLFQVSMHTPTAWCVSEHVIVRRIQR